MGSVNSNDEIKDMHEDLQRLSIWSEENEMPFNVSKCKVIHLGKKNPKEVYTLDGQTL